MTRPEPGLPGGQPPGGGKRCLTAIEFFQQAREPSLEAVVWNRFGMAFHKAAHWDETENYYRESARIKEELSRTSGVNGARTIWNNLGLLSQKTGKPEAEEMWFRKIIAGSHGTDQQVVLGTALGNLARTAVFF
jgi:hypothetical protein